jgi:hypothetical protein
MRSNAHLQTKAHYYGMSESTDKGKEASNPPPPLHIENIVGETMTCIPKGSFKKDSHNPNERASQKYSIVEDLAKTPCVMSSLEVLHSFPSQRKALLSALGVVEPANSGTIVFDPTDHKPHFPYHVTFHMVVVYATKSLT